MNKAYAYKNVANILEKSSSGGAFLGIVKAFVDMAGKDEWHVYGAKFNDNFDVVHDKALTINECYAFCGSKYVQSDISLCFDEICCDLNNGCRVLFTGTPCQIGAVKKYIENKKCPDEHLITIDIACHGAPSKKIWQDYVKYLERENKSKLVEFSFRYKKKGWKGYPILAKFQNGKKYENNFKTSGYMTMFRKNLLAPERCFNCQFAGNYMSDITIADFWGVEICMPEVPTKGGVSVIIAHSKKGDDLLEKMNAKDVLLEQTPNDDYIKYNSNLYKPTTKPKNYDEFWKDYETKGIEYVLKKYGENNLKGKIKFNIKRFLRDSGLLAIIKKVIKKA